MSTPPEPSPPDLVARVAQLEHRLARLEAQLNGERPPVAAGAVEPAQVSPTGAAADSAAPFVAADAGRRGPAADEFEYEVGQAWFARAGIVALALGGAFLLTLPYPGRPPWLASAAGLGATLLLFVFARAGRRLFPLVSRYLRAAGMALLYCSALRLSFFGQPSALDHDSTAALALLSAASAVNVLLAWRRHSPALMTLAFGSVATTLVAVGNASVVLTGGTFLAGLASVLAWQPRWRPVLPVAVALTFPAYAIWAMGDPLIGAPYHWVNTPAVAPFVALAWVAIFGWGLNGRPDASPDQPAAAFATFLVCVLGYGALLIHTAAVADFRFGGIHALASIVFIALAASAWHRHRSQIATFFYAMCGYAALTAAIVHLSVLPMTLVWLSLESVVVVATAIWFRSRFVVVANFVIYGAVVLAYLLLNQHETGVSIAFGLVALVTARVLNWKRHRLALKTDLMRNAYLLCAFVIFPYALYHLVPASYAAITWVGLAVVYYALNLLIQNQKYRWMGHATLLLTAAYIVVPGRPEFTAGFRIASLLVLGVVLVAVSLVFSWRRRVTRSMPAS